MKDLQPATITAPGISVTIGQPPIFDEAKVSTTISSALVNFEHIKHLLSNKPLRRPNRSKPID